MTETKNVIAIYNENCGLAGRQAYEPRNYNGLNWPYDDGDVTVYEGTDDELREEAEFIYANGSHPAAGFYRCRVARSIADAIGYTLIADREQ